MLLDLIRKRSNGLRLYGLTPPKRGQDPARIRDIAEKQIQRISSLAPDGLVLYDLQDEAGRTGVERPFPFLPTLEPMDYARGYLAALPIPKVIYKCVANLDRAEFLSWLGAFSTDQNACVLVGAPSSQSAQAATQAGPPGSHPGTAGGSAGSLALPEAYELLRQNASPACFGGVAIAERHARKGDEDGRLLVKHAAGCGFFISQTIYNAEATKSLLSDYALRFAQEGLEPSPFILSFSPCGSLKTMEFMKWLGISFPRWLENELRHSPSILARSIDLAQQVFADISLFAEEKKIPIGVNVESVSIRKEEIDASCELFTRLSRMMAPN
ncbi:MAG: 5,10-methylenetetrahydrofolate reductase [Fibrobacterota bacterium]|nr:5,10-methylenetetrahydrofolate reductase [Fibrobacterota bacterium]